MSSASFRLLLLLLLALPCIAICQDSVPSVNPDTLVVIDTTPPRLTIQDTFPVIDQAVPKQKKQITPKRVALLALAAPGLGQIYNRKYWKLPIVYGLIGTGAFFIGRNARELKIFNTALDERFDSTKVDRFEGIYSTDQLYAFRSFYQRNVEVSAILTGVAWALQIVDAVVDAHLKSFDISDDLSLRVKPTLSAFGNGISPGVGVQLRFR